MQTVSKYGAAADAEAQAPAAPEEKPLGRANKDEPLMYHGV